MSGPSKVIVLEPDPRAARLLQLGFEREGVPAVVPALPEDPEQLVGNAEAGLWLIGGTDGRALGLLRRAHTLREAAGAQTPVLFAGHGVDRADAEAAGADEIVMRPAYLRDVVTIGRLLRGVPAGQRDHLVGNLVELTGVFPLVRALATMGRSAVLTLIRGLRRGEVRFYQGEVTSAQVGLIHGQAALHQLLLWTDARFDYAHEEIVRRQQIPLSLDELFADAEQFLEGVREAAGELSPATVLEQDVMRVQGYVKQIPSEVHGILRMFDGHRVLADILEDSPYRVFETLRVAQRAVEIGLLRPVEAQRAKSTWRAVLAIEEWLVGNETRDAVVERTAELDTGKSGPLKKFRKSKRRKRRTKTPPATAVKPDIDWGALMPRGIGAEVGPISGVVPALATVGEIEIASRAAPREGLEALMDTDKRTKIFPTEIGVEPSIVVRGGDTDEWERIEWEAKQRVLAEEKARESGPRIPITTGAVTERPPTTVDGAGPPLGGAADGARIPAVDVADAVTVQATETTAGLTATPVVAIAEAALPPTAVPADPSPSDGVVRAALGTADTPPQAKPERPPHAPPPKQADSAGAPAIEPPAQSAEHVSPPAMEPPLRSEVQPAEHRSPTAIEPHEPQPSSLVSDLAAAHAAIASVVAKLDTAPPGDSASPSRELAVAEVRKDAVEFSEAEEAFFRRADTHPPPPVQALKVETFEDLDEGYEPEKFWDRVFGRTRRPPTES
jgi:hypothetical protein